MSNGIKDAELATLRAENERLRELVIQYRNDLKRPPSGDSRDRRLEAISAALHAGDCDECGGLRKDPDNGMPCPVCCSSDDLEAWNPHAGENDD